eukprot:gene337-429_t
MNQQLTFSLIKPEVVKGNQVGNVLAQIEQHGFTIQALQMMHLDLPFVQKFYDIHKARPFFEALCNYMISGPIVAMLLTKDNAVADFRKLIGATNPIEAAEGTIRKRFGKSIDENAIHGSDSNENAQQEGMLFFPDEMKKPLKIQWTGACQTYYAFPYPTYHLKAS